MNILLDVFGVSTCVDWSVFLEETINYPPPIFNKHHKIICFCDKHPFQKSSFPTKLTTSLIYLKNFCEIVWHPDSSLISTFPAGMLLSGVQGRFWHIHPGPLEDPCSQVCLCHHLWARRLWRLSPHWRHRSWHPGVPRYQSEEGTLSGKGGAPGCRACSAKGGISLALFKLITKTFLKGVDRSGGRVDFWGGARVTSAKKTTKQRGL